jgi:Uri superfamily endonuclease
MSNYTEIDYGSIKHNCVRIKKFISRSRAKKWLKDHLVKNFISMTTDRPEVKIEEGIK